MSFVFEIGLICLPLGTMVTMLLCLIWTISGDDKPKVKPPEPPRPPAPPVLKRPLPPALVKKKEVLAPPSPPPIACPEITDKGSQDFARKAASLLTDINLYSFDLTKAGEEFLFSATGQLKMEALAVLADFGTMPVIPGEKKIAFTRVLVSCLDVLKSYRDYRTWENGDIDVATANVVSSGFVDACETISDLRSDRKKNVLNNLAVELQVLRDVTRR